MGLPDYHGGMAAGAFFFSLSKIYGLWLSNLGKTYEQKIEVDKRWAPSPVII